MNCFKAFSTKYLRMAWLCCLAFTLCSFGYQLYRGQWLETELQSLLPGELEITEMQRQADIIQEKRFNNQLVALIGNPSAEQAQQLALELDSRWREHQELFSTVDLKINPDLNKLQNEIKQLRLALLPAHIQQELQTAPQQYFQQYAEQILNPFSRASLLSIEQDWLGLGRFVTTQTIGQTAMSWDPQSAMLQIKQANMTWVLLRATLQPQNLMASSSKLALLMEQSRAYVTEHQGQFLVTAAALFSNDAKQKAESESTLMTIIGLSLTLLLLWVSFRNWRVLWLFLPIFAGMLGGITATISAFGHVHILTLVIGTSLVGVLIDFPLHWLASSLFTKHWQPTVAMHKLRFTFVISLLITLLGYVLLAFTVLPILTQTAVFSIAALIYALLTTMLVLPPLFPIKNSPPRERLQKIRHILYQISYCSIPKPLWILLIALWFGGIWQSQWQDDIRQWVSLPPKMVAEAQKIAELSGINLSSQYFLVTASNEPALLSKLSSLETALQQQGVEFQSLGQWFIPKEQQQLLQQQLKRLTPQDYVPLIALGIPLETLETAATELQQQPLVDLSQALQTELGQSKQQLYLGRLDEQTIAAIIPINNTSANLQQLANGQDIFWQNRRNLLNQAFTHTRVQAAWLKAFSFLLAGALLWHFFGIRKSLQILTPPLLAITITLSFLGWLNIPIGLFSLFGLLLVSAIGIDYSAYMQSAQEPLSYKRIAILLAATTTIISFVLLGISSTPAVAAFGLSVSIGVAFSVFLTLRLFR